MYTIGVISFHMFPINISEFIFWELNPQIELKIISRKIKNKKKLNTTFQNFSFLLDNVLGK